MTKNQPKRIRLLLYNEYITRALRDKQNRHSTVNFYSGFKYILKKKDHLFICNQNNIQQYLD